MAKDENAKKRGRLYIVSTPIGNTEDITLRALRVLKKVDFVVCEEGKEGAKTLKKYNINKTLEQLNEHNEEEKAQELIFDLDEGREIALISDAGSPILADPGLELLKAALRRGIDIEVIPGVSSLTTAIVRSGFELDQFLYAGFLSRDKSERIKQLRELSAEKRTVVLMETPYRLHPLLEAAEKVMPFRSAYIGCNLTMPYETHHYGSFRELYNKFKNIKFKGEFIIVFEGLPHDNFSSPPKKKKKHKDSKRVFVSRRKNK